jgi:multisubunit Na+/H+ antiporter MnhF subunit
MIALYLILAATALCFIRLFLGPTVPDRVLAVDSIAPCGILVLVIFGIQYGQEMLLDVAIAFTILAFMGTIVISKYLGGDKF